MILTNRSCITFLFSCHTVTNRQEWHCTSSWTEEVDHSMYSFNELSTNLITNFKRRRDRKRVTCVFDLIRTLPAEFYIHFIDVNVRFRLSLPLIKYQQQKCMYVYNIISYSRIYFFTHSQSMKWRVCSTQKIHIHKWEGLSVREYVFESQRHSKRE